MSTSSRQRRHQKTRKMILAVTRNMIADKGYENVTLRAIAREADYSPAGLYEYFESKDDLIEALCEQVNEELVEALNQIPATHSISEKLLEMSLAYVRFGLENRALFRLMGNIPSRRRSLDEPAIQGSAYSLILGLVQALINESRSIGSASYAAEEITYGLWALMQGMVSLRLSYLKDFEADFSQINRRILEKVIQGLMSEKE